MEAEAEALRQLNPLAINATHDPLPKGSNRCAASNWQVLLE